MHLHYGIMKLHAPKVYNACKIHTIDGGQRMCGDVLGVYQLPVAGLVCKEGVKEAVLRPRCCCAIVFKVGCKALIQPQLSPIVTCYQVPKPLQSP